MACFEAKFAGIGQSSSSTEGNVGVVVGRGVGGASGGSSVSTSNEEVDCTLHGNWAGLWENQLQKCKLIDCS